MLPVVTIVISAPPRRSLGLGRRFDRPSVEAEERDQHTGREEPPVLEHEAVAHDRQRRARTSAASTTATACGCVRVEAVRARSASSAPPAGSFTSRPSSSSVYLRCQNSSRCVDDRDHREVVLGRRRRDAPLERAARPTGLPAPARPAQREDHVDEEHEHRQGDDERADRREQVQRVPAHARRVGVGAAGLALEARGSASGRT